MQPDASLNANRPAVSPSPVLTAQDMANAPGPAPPAPRQQTAERCPGRRRERYRLISSGAARAPRNAAHDTSPREQDPARAQRGGRATAHGPHPGRQRMADPTPEHGLLPFQGQSVSEEAKQDFRAPWLHRRWATEDRTGLRSWKGTGTSHPSLTRTGKVRFPG